MLRELIHLARHVPGTLALKRRLEQVDLYETVMESANAAGFLERRRALVGDLTGDVLEVGCGTGLMFTHYGSAARVRAIDVDDAFLDRARTRATPHIEVSVADAQHLPFDDASFDAVVSCLVFCSIPDAKRALAEARRVLKPGGKLRMVEHVISEHAIAAGLMHLVDPLWLWLNEQGCHMDCDTVSLVRDAFGDIHTERFQIYSDGLPAFPMCIITSPPASSAT
jgi:SAM-dependent methyltransferase